MSERFEDYVSRVEKENWLLVEFRGFIAIVEHPKGKSRTLYLTEVNGELHVECERSGHNELPGLNQL